MEFHQPWPYPVRLPPKTCLLFNIADRLDLEGAEVALVLRTRPLPSLRYGLRWCEPSPTIIAFALPDRGNIGTYWTTKPDRVTFHLCPPDVLIVPLQRPKGKWYRPAEVTCSIVKAMHRLPEHDHVRQVYGLGREAFAELVRFHMHKAHVGLSPQAGYIHHDLDPHSEFSPAHMQPESHS